jgi:hypothetical protein
MRPRLPCKRLCSHGHLSLKWKGFEYYNSQLPTGSMELEYPIVHHSSSELVIKSTNICWYIQSQHFLRLDIMKSFRNCKNTFLRYMCFKLNSFPPIICSFTYSPPIHNEMSSLSVCRHVVLDKNHRSSGFFKFIIRQTAKFSDQSPIIQCPSNSHLETLMVSRTVTRYYIAFFFKEMLTVWRTVITLTRQKYFPTKIFPYIFHIKPLIFITFSWSHSLADFHEIFTFNSRIIRGYFNIFM